MVPRRTDEASGKSDEEAGTTERVSPSLWRVWRGRVEERRCVDTARQRGIGRERGKKRIKPSPFVHLSMHR